MIFLLYIYFLAVTAIITTVRNIMKRIKPVTIYKSSSRKTLSFQLKIFSFFLFVFFLLALGSRELPISHFQTKASSSDLIAQSLPYFPSPSPEVEPSVALPFSSFLEPTATQAADPSQQTDFCVKLPILLYHHTQPMEMADLLGHGPLTVDSNIFDEQIHYLVENGYTLISADDLINALHNHQALPPKSVMITIDDAYDDNYTYAFSTAKKYNVVMNFMIPTGLVGKSGYMTWDHVKEMSKNPLAKLYNHTWTHADLGSADQEKIELEISTSQKQFEENLGFKPTIFTYPYGSYSDLAIDVLKKEGFVGAFTTEGGINQCESRIMKLYRLHVGNEPLSGMGF